eukprot:TRINITY_DN6182_c0_g1_i2.p1 TRINITY_DN6182_c0_g1~~TRINITY_DN6182_c0_g1_i2.p1  ORF type:complete len:149 (+),score=25.15 TRINITY_DN6182_c0_g1_i2:112-558(+)
MFLKTLISTGRSSIFLAFFVSIYQVVACVDRRIILKKEARYSYFIAGLISSLSIYIEKKSKREELAMYVLPRAVDSLYLRKNIIGFKNGEILIFALSMSYLLYIYRKFPNFCPTLIRSILNYVVPQSRSNLPKAIQNQNKNNNNNNDQ